MGATSSVPLGDEPLEKLCDFKKLAAAPEQYNIPEIPQMRQATDKLWLLLFIANIALLCILLTYTLVYTDCRRSSNGYDQCGNICGEINAPVDGIPCSGKDMTGKSFLKFDDLRMDRDWLLEKRHCTESCPASTNESSWPSYVVEQHRCFPKVGAENDVTEEEFGTGSSISIQKILILLTIAVILSVVMMVLLRFTTAGLIWTTVIASYVLLFAATCIAWHQFSQSVDREGKDNLAVISTILTIVLVIATCFLAATFNRINLVVSVFKEAMKAVFAMPSIILIPFYNFLLVFILILVYINLISIMVASAGVLTKVSDDFYVYEPNGAMLFTILFFSFMFIWIWQFILACEVIVVAGAVSSWYFSRDKTFLGRPVWDSWTNLTKFHTGSAALGSLVLTMVEIVRLVLNSLSKNKSIGSLIDLCMRRIKDLIFYISKNAYIQIGMHGEGFYRSGKRAAKLLYHNLCDVVMINSIGDFVLIMIKAFVIIFTIFFGIFVFDANDKDYYLTIGFGGILAGVLAHCIFKMFETVIDTIFLCYCEDYDLNDGVDRPYYMSDDLMQFVEETRRFNAPKDVANV